jgi:Flp pilus assembly protein TadG
MGARARLESGNVLILTAVSLATLLTLSALTFSASYAYDSRNVLQAAADAAAKSAATELLRDSTLSTPSLTNFAQQQVNLQLANGTALTAGACGTSTIGTAAVCVYHPPNTDPAYAGDFGSNTGYVEVTVQQPTQTFFGFAPSASLAPLARATAGYGNPVDCIITMQDLSFDQTGLYTQGCSVAVGGNLNPAHTNSVIQYSSTQVNPLPSVSVTGTCSGNGCPAGNMTTGAPSPTDPLASLPDYTSPTGTNCPGGSPYPNAVPDGSGAITPGCYADIPNTVTTFQAGNYYITGTINVGNTMTANGVMLYLAGASATISAPNSGGHHELNITAPSSGTYEGIAIFQSRSDTANWNIVDNAFVLDLTGVIYAPTVNLNFNNGLTVNSTGCSVFIGNSLTIKSGNGSFEKNNCASTFGGAAFLSVSVAE